MPPIKPNAKKLKRNTLKTDETGFLDFIYIAFHEWITVFPTIPPLTNVIAYGDYATTIDGFDSNTLILNDVPGVGVNTAVSRFQKVDVVRNSVRLETKGLNSLADSSAIETTVAFKMDNSPKALGFLEMHKRADVQIILEKANGQQLWIGRNESPAHMGEFNEPIDINASVVDFNFKVLRYPPVYLTSVLELPDVDTEYEGHEIGV